MQKKKKKKKKKPPLYSSWEAGAGIYVQAVL